MKAAWFAILLWALQLPLHGSIQLAHRPYDPVGGRFLSFDPLGLGASDNPYGFPADPINYDDPLGLFAVAQMTLGNENAYTRCSVVAYDAGDLRCRPVAYHTSVAGCIWIER